MCLKAAIKAVYFSLTCLAFTSHVKHESVCLESNTFRYEVMFECLKYKVAFKNIYVEVNKKCSCNLLLLSLCVKFAFVLHSTWLLLLPNFCIFGALKYFLLQLIFPLWKKLRSPHSEGVCGTMFPSHASALSWIFEVVLAFPEKWDEFQ